MNYTELRLPQKGDRVVVGLSGGVDSTMTALLLKEAGCDVYCVTMSLWDDHVLRLPEGYAAKSATKDSCFSPKEKDDIEAARIFCSSHNIPYSVIDVKQKYREEVIEYFKKEYRAGRTPNPCVRCNSLIKFGALLAGLRNLDISYDWFCTGHYARLVRPSEDLSALYRGAVFSSPDRSQRKTSRPPLIKTAFDKNKDQSYFLYRIPSTVLEKVRFPLGSFTKAQIKEMARARGLSAAAKPESQDFVSPVIRESVFSDRQSTEGDVIDFDGRVLGRHKGIEHYTIGQRRGLGISSPYPLYVARIDAKRNLVVLGREDDLLCEGLIADDMTWPGERDPDCEFSALVKIRAAASPVAAIVSPYDTGQDDDFARRAYKIVFETPQKAVAPGQSVVLYKRLAECVTAKVAPGTSPMMPPDASLTGEDGAVIIGGGIIVRALHNGV